MTSTENDKQTEDFFEEHNYFNYPKESVKFFKQGNLPLISEDGKLLVDEKYNIKSLQMEMEVFISQSMKKAGILDDMKAKGVEWVFIGSVR